MSNLRGVITSWVFFTALFLSKNNQNIPWAMIVSGSQRCGRYKCKAFWWQFWRMGWDAEVADVETSRIMHAACWKKYMKCQFATIDAWELFIYIHIYHIQRPGHRSNIFQVTKIINPWFRPGSRELCFSQKYKSVHAIDISLKHFPNVQQKNNKVRDQGLFIMLREGTFGDTLTQHFKVPSNQPTQGLYDTNPNFMHYYKGKPMKITTDLHQVWISPNGWHLMAPAKMTSSPLNVRFFFVLLALSGQLQSHLAHNSGRSQCPSWSPKTPGHGKSSCFFFLDPKNSKPPKLQMKY